MKAFMNNLKVVLLAALATIVFGMSYGVSLVIRYGEEIAIRMCTDISTWDIWATMIALAISAVLWIGIIALPITLVIGIVKVIRKRFAAA